MGIADLDSYRLKRAPSILADEQHIKSFASECRIYASETLQKRLWIVAFAQIRYDHLCPSGWYALAVAESLNRQSPAESVHVMAQCRGEDDDYLTLGADLLDSKQWWSRRHLKTTRPVMEYLVDEMVTSLHDHEPTLDYVKHLNDTYLHIPRPVLQERLDNAKVNDEFDRHRRRFLLSGK